LTSAADHSWSVYRPSSKYAADHSATTRPAASTARCIRATKFSPVLGAAHAKAAAAEHSLRIPAEGNGLQSEIGEYVIISVGKAGRVVVHRERGPTSADSALPAFDGHPEPEAHRTEDDRPLIPRN
jgi:hypothetical protein